MAWLNATPKPAEGTKRAKHGLGATMSRIDTMKRHKITPSMPPNPAPHLVDRLVEIGLTEAGAMGAAPLSWQSIVAWQQARRIRISSWEANLIHKLSIAYLAESRLAESENRPAPWRGEVSEQEAAAEIDQLRAALG